MRPRAIVSYMARGYIGTFKLGTNQRKILQELSAGDLLYGFLLSSHSAPRMMRLAHERATGRYRRKCTIERLSELGFIQSRGEKLSITNTGRNALGDSVEKNRSLLREKQWDGKWRIAAFDIPEKYAPLRNSVRKLLKRAGFVQLQKSIWIFPHDCKQLVELIQKESDIAKHILYGVLEHIEDDARLKKLFRLKI